MNLSNPRRNELTGIPFLNNALDLVLSRFNKIWAVEHHDDGTHGAVTAESITTTGDVTTDGDVTAEGDTHTLGEFVFESGPSQTQEKLTIAGTTNGWRLARKAASSPLNGTYAFAVYDMASPNFPVLELGTVTGVYHLLPHDSATLALGHGASSGDRILALYVQNGMFETGRTTAAGYWTSYTPAWTGSTTNPTLGNGTLTGAYSLVGKTVSFGLKLTIGGTTSVATGNWLFSLPQTAAAVFQPVVNGFGQDASTGNIYTLVAALNSATTLLVLDGGTSNATIVTDLSPITWASGDTLYLSGSYEMA